MDYTKFTEAYKQVLVQSNDDSKLRKLVRDIVEEVRNEQYLKFLEEDYKASEKRFLDQGAEPEEVKKILAFHRDNKNTFKGNLKDIDAQKDWKEFSSQILSLTKQKEKAQEYKTTLDEVILRDDSEWLIIVPLNHRTSCYRGSGTDWCVTKQDQSHFSQYFYEAEIILVYCIKKNETKDKWAAALHLDKLNKTEFFDRKDKKLKQIQFEKQTKLKFDDLVKGVRDNLGYIQKQREINSKKDIYYLTKLAMKAGKRNPELEDMIIAQKSAKSAVNYAEAVIKGPFKEAEDIIAKDPESSILYAWWVLKGRFEKGEDAISKDGPSSHKYAAVILKGPFPKGEDAIANDPGAALSYATLILKDPNPETWAQRYLKDKRN